MMVMKFLPFDESDLKKLDKLIAAEEYQFPCKPETTDREVLKAWKRAYMKAWRMKMKLEEPEKFKKVTVEKRDWMRRSRA